MRLLDPGARVGRGGEGRGGDEGPRVKRASAKGHPRGRLRCVTADKG